MPTLDCDTSGTSPFTSTNKHFSSLNPPVGRQCQVTAERDGSFVSGEYSLSISYPHQKVGTPDWGYTTEPISWRATSDELEVALEAVRDGHNTPVFGRVAVERHAYWPPGVFKWSGQYNWSVTFETRPGDVPQMISNSLTGVPVSVGTSRNGNEINGGFGLSFCPSRGDCSTTNSSFFGSDLSGDEMKNRFSQAFFTRGGSITVSVNGLLSNREVYTEIYDGDTSIEGSDWLRFDGNDYVVESVLRDPTGDIHDHILLLATDVLSGVGTYDASFGTTAVSVTRTGPNQAMGYSWEVTFSNKTVGGDQPEVTSVSDNLSGSGADIMISETQQGNQLTGSFTLSYNGETTSEIPFDASAASMQSAISSLSGVYPSRVDVSRTRLTAVDRFQQVGGYTWTITFDSDTWHDPTDHSFSDPYIDGSWIGNPAEWGDTWPSSGAGRFSKVWGKNIGILPNIECSADGLGTTRQDGSENCKVRYMLHVACYMLHVILEDP